MPSTVETGPGWELRLGDFRAVLASVEGITQVICDPPYLSAKVDIGGGSWAGSQKPDSTSLAVAGQPVMGYEPASAELLTSIVDFSRTRASGWLVAFNDFDGVACMRQHVQSTKGTASEPIAWVKPPCLTPRRGANYLPEKGTEYILAARWNRQKANGRMMPGAYVSPRNTQPGNRTLVVTGGKPLALMRAIVRDYTEPGDLICDPTAGGATTLLAAVIEGRRAIGAELDPKTYAKAVARLRGGYTPTLFGDEPRADLGE
jgi:site-specific DNA-methyltransferase (adenine-specific)